MKLSDVGGRASLFCLLWQNSEYLCSSMFDGFFSGWIEAEYKPDTLLDNIFGEGDLTKLQQTLLMDFRIFEDVVGSFLSNPS